MNQTLIRWVMMLFVSFLFMNSSSASSLSGDPATFKFSLNNCNAWIPSDDNHDFSEFTGTAFNTNEINMSAVGGHLYRTDPDQNGHSCTPGLNDTNAMCISANEDCLYPAGDEQSLRFDIELRPTGNKFVRLSELSFYELAPELFTWNDGFTSVNDYPTRYAVRVLKNGQVVFQQEDIQCTQEWSLESFTFSGPAFTVGTPTVFNFELLAYCPIGIGAVQHVWDLEDIEITAECLPQNITNGGEITGGPFSYCIDAGPYFLPSIGLFFASGQNQAWVVTDGAGQILALPDNPSEINFASIGGTAYLQNISYQNGLSGLTVGSNISNLNGIFSFSNTISVTGINPSGGNLAGGPFNFCVDGEGDFVSGLSITGSSGSTMQWVVTDATGLIMDLPANIEGVNFDAAGVGDCFIWNVTYETVSGLAIGQELDELSGCYGVSNGVLVRREIINGGSLEGGPFEFCVDGEADFISDITLSGVDDDLNTVWIITDVQLNILGIPDDPTQVNFDEAGPGVCFLWNIAYSEEITGVEVDNVVSQIEGCYGISNSIRIERIQPEGGTLEGGPFEFCVDGVEDNVSGISLTGATGTTNGWIVTDEDGVILGLPDDIEDVNFDDAGVGTCLIWNISFTGEIDGLDLEEEVSDLSGCFGISNSIAVVRSTPNGGTLTGGPYNFCIDDEDDIISDLELEGNNGDNSAWIVTDEDGVILDLPEDISDVNFNNAPGGICLIYSISYQNGLEGLSADENIDDLDGCFGLSNSISVNRTNPLGGVLEGGPYAFCLDGVADMITDLSVAGNSGVNSSWLITDEDLDIIAVTNELDTINFDGAGPGVCLIWNISYGSDIVGLSAENSVNDLEGCFAISDSVVVTRTNVAGGTLEGGPFNFCLDETADMVSDLVLSDNSGDNSTFLITDEDGQILEITNEPDTIDFNGAVAGTCFIWNISYQDGLDGLEAGNEVSDLEGCFGLSNSITVTRSNPEGGTLTSDDFDFMIDGMPDMVSGIVLSDTSASNYAWIVTDINLEIVGLPQDIETVNFDDAGVGICLIWHIGYGDGLENLSLGNNVNDLEGCFDISNSITVNRNASAGGVIEGGPFDFCVDGDPDMVSVSLTGAMGTNSQWIITNDQDSIVGLPDNIEMVDFDAAGVGICYIYHLSYEDNTMGIALGNFLSDLTGGFALSNNLIVNRTQPTGGTLSGGPYSFCIDDQDDFITDLVLTGNVGSNTQWIVTDEDENIITVTDSIQNVNFNDADEGTCLIWSISYEDGINGLISNSPLSILDGCFNLSNSIQVDRSEIDGGTLTGGPFNFCIDMEMDTVSNVVLTGASGQNNSWIITDEEGLIIGLPDTITNVDFNAAGNGICLIWNISYQDGLTGLEADNNVSELVGCYNLSNSIVVTRSEPSPGVITGGPFNFTVDGIEDNVSGIDLMGNVAPNAQWVVTSLGGNISVITDDIETVNFDAQGVGECLIWHIGFLDGISGLIEGNNLDDIEGCFAISNSISVMKMASTGGQLFGGPFNFCVDDEEDFVSGLEITDNMGSLTGWIITDTDGLILGLPNNPELVDFNAAGAGTCYIYHISYEPGLTGLAVDLNISGLTGTFGLSNFVEVNRTTPEAGTLTGGPYEFCLEGTPDMITDFELTGNVGANTSWIITDDNGVIVGLPDTLENVNFEEAGPGVCLIYSITYNDNLEGLAVDSLLTNLEGCFDLTDNLTVTRNEISGGTLEGGPFNFCIDETVDNVTNITLSGQMGPNLTWVVTDTFGVISHIVESTGEVDFNQTGAGVCRLYNLTYDNGTTGIVVDGNIDAIQGCFSFSNFITIEKTAPVGGTVSGESIEICIDDMDNFVADFTVSGNAGSNSSWLVTDEDGEILGIPADIESFNFNNLNPGTCLVWHISYESDLEGLFVGESVNDLAGCFSISSNNIAITKTEPLGGNLSPINYSFCSDGTPDLLVGLTLVDTVGVNFSWVITDIMGEILDLPMMIDTVDFDDEPLGTCLVYSLVYEDGLTGLEIGENTADLEGCYDFSNSVQVLKEDCVLMSNDSIVINEIFPDENLVELKNVGDIAIDISGYTLCQFPNYGPLANLQLDCNSTDLILDPGEILAVEMNAPLTSNQGEMALYNSDLVDDDYINSDYIIDYVEWGFAGHQRAPVAIAAGIWSSGSFVPAFSINSSIEYDGIGNSPFDWTEDSPTICIENSFTDPNPTPTETKYSLYPNPGKDEIRLDFTRSPAAKVQARVFNSFGKLLIVQEIELEFGEEPIIDITQLNEGAYILEVSAKGFSQTQRFIKIN